MRRIMPAILLCLFFCGCESSLTPIIPVATNGGVGEQPHTTLRVGVCADYPPFAYLDERGEPAGLDIALAGLLAEKMNMRLELHNMSFDALLEAVRKKQVSMAIAALTPTPERMKLVDFSDVYFKQRLVLLVPKELLNKAEYDDWRVAVPKAWQYADVAALLMPKARLQDYDTWGAMVEAVRKSEADAAFMDMALAESFARDGLAVLEMNTDSVFTQGVAIALPKDDLAFRKQVNQALDDIGPGKINEIMRDALLGME